MTEDLIVLRGAHLLDLRRGRQPLSAPTPVPVPGVPDVLPVLSQRTSSDGWVVACGSFPYGSRLGVVAVITSPDGGRVMLCDEVMAHYIEKPDDLGDRFHLTPLFKPDGPTLSKRAIHTWQVVARLHQIARSLPRMASLSVIGDDRNLAVRYVLRSLAWANLSEAEALRWQEAGFVSGRDAESFARLGLEPDWSIPWAQQGITPRAAVAASEAGWTPADIAALGRVFDATKREDDSSIWWPGEQRAWVDSGLAPRMGILACAAGLTPAEAVAEKRDELSLRTLAVLRGWDAELLP